MDPRIILEHVVKRLEDPELGLGRVGPGQFSAWAGKEPALREKWAEGRGHLAWGLRIARQALASGDSDRIRLAALLCPTYERDGMARRAAAEREGMARSVAAPRKRGGKKRGEALAQEAATIWAPYVALFKNLGGTEKARNAVRARMRKNNFVLPATGNFPDDRTIRKRLPLRKAEGS
jgi:hypothetical protein